MGGQADLARAQRPAAPPTRATTEAWWCGARNGGRSSSAPSGRAQPAAEWMRVTVEGLGGRQRWEQPEQALGQHRLARPGGPIMRRWWRRPRRPRGHAGPRPGPGRRPGRAGRRLSGRGGGGGTVGPVRRAAQERTRSASVAAPWTASPRTRAASRTSQSGHDHAKGAGGVGQGDHARHMAQRAVESELAAEGEAVGAGRAAARRRPRGADGDGQVEAGAALAHAGGARLTVIRRSGQGRPLERMAARTRSRASRTAASGSPTMVKPGRPLETWTSTETGRPTAPISVAEATEASMPENGRPEAVPRARSVPNCYGGRRSESGSSMFPSLSHSPVRIGDTELLASSSARRTCRSRWPPRATVLLLKTPMSPDWIAWRVASINVPAASTIFDGAADCSWRMTDSLASRAERNAADVVVAENAPTPLGQVTFGGFCPVSAARIFALCVCTVPFDTYGVPAPATAPPKASSGTTVPITMATDATTSDLGSKFPITQALWPH